MRPEHRPAVDAIAQVTKSDVNFDAELARAWARIWVAEAPGSAEPAAFLLAWAVADELHVMNVATHPDQRRKGAGTALMRALLEYASSERVRLVLLEVRRSNRVAIGLYRAHGFRAMGVRRQYYADNAEDAIEMMLELDPETGTILVGRDEVQIEPFSTAMIGSAHTGRGASRA